MTSSELTEHIKDLHSEPWDVKYEFIKTCLPKFNEVEIESEESYRQMINTLFSEVIILLSDFCDSVLSINSLTTMRLYAYSMFREFLNRVTKRTCSYFNIEIAPGEAGDRLDLKIEIPSHNVERYYIWQLDHFKQYTKDEYELEAGNYSNDNTDRILNLIPLTSQIGDN